MRNPYVRRDVPFALDGFIRVPIGPNPDKNWPYSENTDDWVRQWKEDLALFPDLPADDKAMGEWFGMAMNVGVSKAGSQWYEDYYRVFGERSALIRRITNLRRVIFVLVGALALAFVTFATFV